MHHTRMVRPQGYWGGRVKWEPNGLSLDAAILKHSLAWGGHPAPTPAELKAAPW